MTRKSCPTIVPSPKPLNVLSKVALQILFPEIIRLMATSLLIANITPLSTENAFLYIHDHLINAVGSQQVSCLCLLDLPAAFDTVLTMTSYPPVYLLGFIFVVLLSAHFVTIFCLDLLLSKFWSSVFTPVCIAVG